MVYASAAEIRVHSRLRFADLGSGSPVIDFLIVMFMWWLLTATVKQAVRDVIREENPK